MGSWHGKGMGKAGEGGPRQVARARKAGRQAHVTRG